MAKTNYTKVEEALAEGLRKMEVNKLLDIADEASAAKKTASDQAKGETTQKLSAEQKQLLASLLHDLKALHRLEDDIYEKLGVNKKEVKRLFKDPTGITSLEWETLKSLKEKVDVVKDELEKSKPQKTDDDIVQQQRRRQTTKRFNINDKWIPLR